jgi:hypothetical protein
LSGSDWVKSVELDQSGMGGLLLFLFASLSLEDQGCYFAPMAEHIGTQVWVLSIHVLPFLWQALGCQGVCLGRISGISHAWSLVTRLIPLHFILVNIHKVGTIKKKIEESSCLFMPMPTICHHIACGSPELK